MEKEKSKRGEGPHWEKLNTSTKQQYLEKTEEINNIDSHNLPAAEWRKDPDALPPLTHPDIVNYLVIGICAYTLQTHYIKSQDKGYGYKKRTTVCFLLWENFENHRVRQRHHGDHISHISQGNFSTTS